MFPDFCLINYLTGTLNVGRPHQGRGQCKGNRKCSSIFSQTPSYWTCWSLVTGQNAQVERLKVGVIPHKQWPGRGWCTWHSDMNCLEVVFSGGGMNLCRGLLSLTSQWGSVALLRRHNMSIITAAFCVCALDFYPLWEVHTLTYRHTSKVNFRSNGVLCDLVY